MSFSIRELYPAFSTLRTLRKVSFFQQWLTDNHPNKKANDLYNGYWFAVYSCVNNIIDCIESDNDLGFQSDFLFDYSTAHNISIDIIGRSNNKYEDCEKLIVLKNLKPYVKAIFKAKNFNGLEQHLTAFEKDISEPFFLLFDNHLVTTEQWKESREKALWFLQIDYLHTFLNQFGGIGPYANSTNCITTECISRQYRIACLEGYAHTVQFLWSQTIGQEKLNQTTLKNMHSVDSYKYVHESTNISMADIFGGKIDYDAQNYLEKYFYKIKAEITDPLEKEYGFYPYRTEDYIFLDKANYQKKKYFINLLNLKENDQIERKLSWNEKIEETLYWFDLRVDNRGRSSRYEPSTSFLIALAGIIALHDPKESEFEKVMLVRFIHPLGDKEGQSDYSYGVVEDTKSVTHHHHSEWTIFQNCCSDYKAYEYNYIEKQISFYEKEGKLDIRELEIPLKDFQNYTNAYVFERRSHDREIENDIVNVVLPDARAYLLELFTYYVFTKSEEYKNFTVSLNTDSRNGKGEKDIVLENEEEVILVECKVNLDNSDLSELLTTLENKMNGFQQQKKSFQLWMWNKPSNATKQYLDTKIEGGLLLSYVVVNDARSSHLLNGVSLRQIRDAMKYATKGY